MNLHWVSGRRKKCDIIPCSQTTSDWMGNQIENITLVVTRQTKTNPKDAKNWKLKRAEIFAHLSCISVSCYPVPLDTLMQHTSNVFRLFNHQHVQIDFPLSSLLTCSFQLCIYSPNENQRAKQKLASKQDVSFGLISSRSVKLESIFFVWINSIVCGGQTEASNGNSQVKWLLATIAKLSRTFRSFCSLIKERATFHSFNRHMSHNRNKTMGWPHKMGAKIGGKWLHLHDFHCSENYNLEIWPKSTI